MRSHLSSNQDKHTSIAGASRSTGWATKPAKQASLVSKGDVPSRRLLGPFQSCFALSKALERRFLDDWHVRLWLVEALACEKERPQTHVHSVMTIKGYVCTRRGSP
jgi:hypothetical protein